MKNKLLCIGIVAIFLFVGFDTVSAINSTKESSNRSDIQIIETDDNTVTIRGWVYISNTRPKECLEGVQVECKQNAGPIPEACHGSTTTDKNGYWEISGVPEKTLGILVLDFELCDYKDKRIVLGRNAPTDPIITSLKSSKAKSYISDIHFMFSLPQILRILSFFQCYNNY